MIATVLLDTSIESLFHPRKTDRSLRAIYAPDISDRATAISFQTVAELYLWADRHHWGERLRGELEELIAGFSVVPPDAALIRTWATVMDLAARAGRRLDAQDGWIVATAVRHKLPLVTHDRDMLGLPIPGLNVITHLR
jgi:tRNA(fMet)-specific endonuclease VapC